MALFFANQPAEAEAQNLPSYGVGLFWAWKSATEVELHSNHISSKIFVPAWSAAQSKGRLFEFTQTSPDAILTLDLSVNGTNGLDTGSVAAQKFYNIRMISKSDGSDVALLATLNAADPNLPAGYSNGFVSDVIWGVACCVELTPGGSTLDDISPFMNSAPGVCNYGGGYYGNPGPSDAHRILTNGAATASTAVDMSYLAPEPVANTARSARGSIRLYCRGHNDNPAAKNGYIIYSFDGRLDTDPNVSHSNLYQFQKLDNDAGEGGRDQTTTIIFPNAVASTPEGTIGGVDYNASTGNLTNILQYKWQGAASCQMNIWVAGWSLDG
jgi:hypothetical protein